MHGSVDKIRHIYMTSSCRGLYGFVSFVYAAGSVNGYPPYIKMDNIYDAVCQCLYECAIGTDCMSIADQDIGSCLSLLDTAPEVDYMHELGLLKEVS